MNKPKQGTENTLCSEFLAFADVMNIISHVMNKSRASPWHQKLKKILALIDLLL